MGTFRGLHFTVSYFPSREILWAGLTFRGAEVALASVVSGLLISDCDISCFGVPSTHARYLPQNAAKILGRTL
jgi:hypothetical protein